MKIAVVGLGYVGLSNAVLLAQHHQVVAVDVTQARVDMVNARRSPIEDVELSDYLANRKLDLTATTDLASAVAGASFVIVATPTDYDPVEDFFNTSSVDSVAAAVIATDPDAVVVVKSTIPVGYVTRLREKLGNRMDGDGRIQVVCDEHRSRHRNIEAALDRLEELLRQALVVQKKRRATKPSRGSQERRLTDKKRRGEIKRMRRGDD